MTNSFAYQPGLDFSSPNRNLTPLNTNIDSYGRLVLSGCILSELAYRYGTPLYVLDEDTIRAGCKAYRVALNKYYPGNSLPLYASKANSSLVISKIVSSEGFGLDVVSEGELLTALNAGIPSKNIVLHGNNKSDREISLAYKNGTTIVIDNEHDIYCLEKIVSNKEKPARIMLRFTPGIECHTHEYIRTGHLDSKFGFDLDELERILIDIKKLKFLDLTGLHAHIGSQIFELEPHRDLASVMADVLKLSRDIGHPVNDLNVGGGLGIRYIESDDPPSIDAWVKVVSDSVVKACESRKLKLPRLMCEPGRSLIATSGLTLYTIGSSKKIPGIRTYLSVDGGMSDNPRPITYQSLYTACLADYPLSSVTQKVTIAGKHCESGDVLIKDIQLPPCKSGDTLVVFGTGAYNISMSSNYNRIPKPAVVLVKNGAADLVQRREQPEDLLRYDVLPDRFQALG